MTMILLMIFIPALAAGALAVAGWGVATAAMGREFDRLALPGDIVQALHAELDARWRASVAAAP